MCIITFSNILEPDYIIDYSSRVANAVVLSQNAFSIHFNWEGLPSKESSFPFKSAILMWSIHLATFCADSMHLTQLEC